MSCSDGMPVGSIDTQQIKMCVNKKKKRKRKLGVTKKSKTLNFGVCNLNK